MPVGVVNVTPQAGDAVVMTEMLAHGTLQWKPKDRLRRTLVLRYRPQFKGQAAVPEVLYDRLSPQTRELMAPATIPMSRRSSKRTWYGSLKQNQNQPKRAPAMSRKCPFFW